MVVYWDTQLSSIPLKYNCFWTISFSCLHQNTLQCSTAISLQLSNCPSDHHSYQCHLLNCCAEMFQFSFPTFLIYLPEAHTSCLTQNMFPLSRHQPSSYLPCFLSSTICFIHAASWAAHTADKSWNNHHFVWTAAHTPYPTMMVEFGRWSLSSSVWHVSSVTLTWKPKPVPSVCRCSVSDRATWTSEALHDAGTHNAQ